MLKKAVYNLYRFEDDLFLPDAYMVSIDKHDQPAHVQHKAYIHHLTDDEAMSIHEPAFKLIEKLSPESLENRFISNRKVTKDLKGLLENPLTKKVVLKYISLKLNEFLEYISNNNLTLCLGLDRNSIANNYIVNYHDSILEPVLFFEKNIDGIIYRLQLKDSNRLWKINSKKVIPICDFPAWIVADHILYRISDVNSSLVKPFRQKEEIHIPNRMIKTYFEKFILKIVKKVDITAKGFEVVIKDELISCRVLTFQNVFNNNWEINLKMVYQGAEFNWNDKKNNKTGIEFDEDNILITKIVRNKEKEQYFIEEILNAGLKNYSGNSFVLNRDFSKNSDSHDVLQWLIDHYSLLVKSGFEVDTPTFQNKTILLESPILKMKTSEKIDWFDVEATILIGGKSIPFSSLKQNIIDQNPYFKLPDGNVFIIPKQWMIKYIELFTFANSSGNSLKLKKSQFTILENAEIKTLTTTKMENDTMFEIPTSLNASLRPYQLDGVRWLLNLQQNELGACLADDMGLGKTLQTLTMLLYTKEQKIDTNPKPKKGIVQLSLFSTIESDDCTSFVNLIILPASLIYNWIAEIQKFAPSLSFYNFTGTKRKKDIDFLNNFNIVLTTYQTALKDLEFLEQIDFDYIVLDESQQIKNRKSKIFNAIIRLKSKHKLSLSGTPIENSLSDLWSQMQFINSELLGNYRFFEKEFIKPIEKYGDEDKLNQLKKIVSPFLLRRTKKEVEKNLPELLVKIHYSDMHPEQKKLYDKEKSAARNYLLKIFDKIQGKYKLEILKVLNRLRQLANHPSLVLKDYRYKSGKFDDIMVYWEELHKAGHKILIFSSYVKYLNIFQKEFEKRDIPYSFLSGSLTQKQREQEIQSFNINKDISTFFMSIKAGGVGLNLTVADYVFILDPWWNPTTEQQAIARAHRIGQDKKVIAVKFITHDTIEEKILQLQHKKSRLAEDILNNNEKIKLEKEDIVYLLE